MIPKFTNVELEAANTAKSRGRIAWPNRWDPKIHHEQIMALPWHAPKVQPRDDVISGPWWNIEPRLRCRGAFEATFFSAKAFRN